MKAKIQCKVCGHTQWVRVIEDDPDTNSFELDDFDQECGHDDYDVTDTEYDDGPELDRY